MAMPTAIEALVVAVRFPSTLVNSSCLISRRSIRRLAVTSASVSPAARVRLARLPSALIQAANNEVEYYSRENMAG
jgi:hypothetical protein